LAKPSGAGFAPAKICDLARPHYEAIMIGKGEFAGKFRQKRNRPENAGQTAVLPALFTKGRSDSFPVK
jgi:hypothetical protein